VTAPNILLILADDQRFDFLPYMPNVRNLIVFPGREFTNCRCNVGLCQPTRVGVLTGQYSKRHGVLDNTPEAIATFDHDDTVAAWLHAVGYRTGLIGKYLNGAPALIPQPEGWDTWRQLIDPSAYDALGYEICDGSTTITPAAFQMDYLRDEALAFVSGSSPWFLLLAPSSPHFPFSPDPADLFAWSDVRWRLVNETDLSDKPSWISSQPPLPDSALDRFRATARKQLREGTALDRAVGAIVASLDTAVLENTVLLYSSDNGLEYGEHGMPYQGIAKNSAYDVTMKVPLAMRGPGIPAGVSSEPVTMGADVTATLVAIAGATATHTPDGVDLRDVIANPGAYASRQLLHTKDVTIFLGSAPAGSGITTATRKLYRYPSETDSDRYEAYDLDTDPDELENWANDPSRLAERDALEAALDALLAAP
jgi:arylsulfatase A-like enzyme